MSTTNYFSGIELPSAPGCSSPAYKARPDKSKGPASWRDVEGFVPMCDDVFELGTSSANQAAYAVLEKFRRTADGKRNYLFSGFQRLDNAALGWLAPGKVIGIVGGSGTGKSAIAFQLAEYVQALNPHKLSVIASGEMSPGEYCERFIAARLSSLNKKWLCESRQIAVGELPEKSVACRAAVEQAAKDFSTLLSAFVRRNEYVEDIMIQVAALFVQLRKLKFGPDDESPIGCLVVDYLQLIDRREKSDTQAHNLGEVAYALKRFAAAIGAPVIVLLQVNREVSKRSATEKILGLDDIKDSGTIGQAMDEIFIIQRPELLLIGPQNCPNYSGYCYLTHNKGRAGSVVPPQLLRWWQGAYREVPEAILEHLGHCFPLQAVRLDKNPKKPVLSGKELQDEIDSKFSSLAFAKGWNVEPTIWGVSTINCEFPSFLDWKNAETELMSAPGFCSGGGCSENTAGCVESENTGGGGAGPEGAENTVGPVGPDGTGGPAVGPDNTSGPAKKKAPGMIVSAKIGGNGGAK